MRAEEILALQRKQPFTGLRLQVSDGTEYQIRHPEMMLVTRTIVHIALPPSKGGVPERSVYCDPMHITRIEPIAELSNGRRRRRKPA